MSAVLDLCCDDIAVHSHDGGRTLRHRGRRFVYRHPFRVVLNRYPGCVIGAGVQVGQRVLSVVWGRPGRPYEVAVPPSA